MIQRRALLTMAAMGLMPSAAFAQSAPGAGVPSPEHIDLWPAGAMEAPPAGLAEKIATIGLAGVIAPRLEVLRPPPASNRHRAVLLIPGGSYQNLVVNKAPVDLAHFLLSRGFTVCMLIYRLPGEGWSQRGIASLQDAQRAMRLMRAKAADWGVDPDKIGAVGFSAGGHLAGMLASRPGAALFGPPDAIDALPCRPAYTGLCYPVVTMDPTFTHARSRANLIGEQPSAADVVNFSNERQVAKDASPTFIAVAADDETVPVANSIAMFSALKAAQVPAELHVFEQGGHGFGVAPPTTAASWPDLFMRWRDRHDPLA